LPNLRVSLPLMNIYSCRYDIVEVEVHPWKPSQAGKTPRSSRLRSRAWTGAGATSGALVASGSRARQLGSSHGWNTAADQRHVTRQCDLDDAVSDVSQNNNNNRDDGQRTRAVSVCLMYATAWHFTHQSVDLLSQLCNITN